MKIMPHERPGGKLMRDTKHIDSVTDDELESMSIAAICRLDGVTVSQKTLSSRIRHKKMDRREAARSGPIRPTSPGSVASRAKALGMCPGTVYARIAAGMDVEDALHTPPMDPVTSAKIAAEARVRKYARSR